METIKLLLANSDRRVNNQVEVAVLDVCYDRAAVESTRASRLDEFVRQGSLRDFDLIIVGTDHLLRDRSQKDWAASEEVARAIETIRAQSSTPIIALAASGTTGESLLQAGADSVLPLPLSSDKLKAELRALLDLNGLVDEGESNRWSGIGSFLRGFQKAKADS
jgi:DNA-binding response OmpR family regulator